MARKKQQGERHACGKLKPQIVPMAALARRAEACGLKADALLKNIQDGNLAGRKCKPTEHLKALTEALCHEGAGRALDRLMWRIAPDGTKARRMMVVDGRSVETITDQMAASADAYRTLWVEWYRTTGLPRRHPQPATIGER